MPYIGVSPFNGVRKKHTYTATASQTSFSGAGTEGITLSYKDSTFVDVFQNGVKLGEADYTSTSGTAIVLAQSASVNDLIEVVVYDVFSVADTVSKADGGTFDGNVTMGGTLDVTGVATATTFEPDGDTAAGDNAAIGYTATEGLILTGQGSTSDVIIKNDADTTVCFVPTGTDDLKFNDSAAILLGTDSDMQIIHDGSNSIISDNGTGNLVLRSNASAVEIDFNTDETSALFNHNGSVELYHDNTKRFETTSGGIDVTGTTTTDNLTVTASAVNFTVDQTANNLTATFKGAGLGTMELIGTSSGGFIDMTQGSNDYDVRFGGNNSGGYIANNSASFSISGLSGFTATIVGALSKSSGSFKISHPLESKKDTHHLFHSFVEGPQCDNLYRGKIELSNGSATVNLDTKSGMTDGTFVALNRDVQCFTTNETGWTAIKGSVSGNVLTITAQDSSCTDTISWLVIGERQDDEIKASSLTDDDGNLVVEKLKSEAPDANQNYGNVE